MSAQTARIERVEKSRSLTGDGKTLEVVIRQITFQANGIQSYEFVAADGSDLPIASAGSHIDVYLGNGLVRQYSLCNDPVERHHYVIAVLRDDRGRGGSKELHATFRVQGLIRIGVPRNNFLLNANAQKHLLLGGGIGMTPMLSMVYTLQRQGHDFVFHYCAKAPEFVAFQRELGPLIHEGRVVLHFDHGQPGAGLNIADLLSERQPGTHLYYCGPAGFMGACAEATRHWPDGTVHFEHFKAPVTEKLLSSESSLEVKTDSFAVKIASTGQLLEIPTGKTILEVLRESGVAVESSCQSGLCASCKVGYLAGEVDHQDFILDETERQSFLTVCVSRAKSDLLVLDL